MFILCLTSNPGSKDFQILNVDGKPLYRVVAEKVAYWNKENNCGLVVGATNFQAIGLYRKFGFRFCDPDLSETERKMILEPI